LPVGGSLSFRFLLQPTVVAIIAIIAGVRDTQAGRPAYFWSIITDAAHRQERLREGWNAIWKVFIVVVVLDVIYEVLVFRTIYPGETLLVAIVLAVIPYMALRGLSNRVARNWVHPTSRDRTR